MYATLWPIFCLFFVRLFRLFLQGLILCLPDYLLFFFFQLKAFNKTLQADLEEAENKNDDLKE